MDTIESSAPAHPSTEEKPDEIIGAHYACLERLEERCELRDRILPLRRSLSR